jgi:DNA-binding PadR family transcriptional regulator
MSEEMCLILVSLLSGPKHGYAIAVDIAEFTGRRLGPGTLYGAIARLERAGYIEALPGEARRRPYRITPAGKKTLRQDLADAQRLSAVARKRLA